MMIALKPQRGDIKNRTNFPIQFTKDSTTAKNGKYFQPFERIELIEPFEQQLNPPSKLNH